ncbi:hypothetical protein LTR17_022659 [Elasticomyces elasticus]|nr:hypothetical protein LTR17_022659 [Elasticomyces elasticus]
MRDVISGSKDLMQRLFLLPNPGSHVDVLSTAGLDGNFMRETCNIKISQTCYQRSADTQHPDGQSNGRLGCEVNVCFDLPLPRLGSRIRQMFITQPPTKRFTMTINCCNPSNRERLGAEPLPDAQITNPAGVTIGELYDEAQRVMQQHTNCAFARWSQHEANGEVDLEVTFGTHLKLPDTQPESIQYALKRQRDTEENDRLKPGKQMIREFCKAKAQAYTEGKAIPTFEQFRSSTADTEANSFETMP